MDEPPKHPAVAAIFTRLLSELGLSGNQLARTLGTSQQVISGYASGRTSPGREMIAGIIRRYPAISAAWLATGEGEPFPAGRFNEKPAGPPDEPTPTPPAAPAAAAGLPFSGEVLDRLLTQINTQAQQHREELLLLKKEHKAELNKLARQGQYNMDQMYNKVHYMEGRLGLRPLTAAETAQAALDAPKTKKIGLKHYDESAPTGRCVPFYPERLAA